MCFGFPSQENENLWEIYRFYRMHCWVVYSVKEVVVTVFISIAMWPSHIAPE